MAHRVHRTGFTLVELVVALTIGAIVLLTARGFVSGVADAGDRLRISSRAADRQANSERLLRALVGQVERGAAGLSGDERRASFVSACAVPGGWQERCTVVLAVDRYLGQPVLAASLGTGELVRLRDGFTDGRLCYLASSADGGRWLSDWSADEALPLAIGVVIDGDTTLVRVGARG